MSIKTERLGNIFVQEISQVIKDEIKDESIFFITITAVRISNDLSYAKVYFTALDNRSKEEITDTLNKAANFIRGKLCERVDIRKMPELTFVYDESIDYGNRIEKIIDQIHKD